MRSSSASLGRISRRGPVHGEGRLVGDRRLGDVDRQDQHRDAALGKCRLAAIAVLRRAWPGERISLQNTLQLR